MAEARHSKETSESESQPSSPTVITDNTGTPLIPTVVPPQTLFPSSSSAVEQQPPSVYQTPATAFENDRQPAEYFGQQPSQSNGLDHDIERTDHAETPANISSQVSSQPTQGLERPSIERAWQTDRPKAPPRSATIMNALRRSTSHNQPSNAANHHPHHPSDAQATSSSSDSDSEEDPGKRSWMGKSRRRKMQREQSYTKFNVGNDQYQSKGKVSKRDGRLNISINETANNGYIAKTLGQTIQHHLGVPEKHGPRDGEDSESEREHSRSNGDLRQQLSEDAASVASSVHETVKRPRLNIVVMVIGSRGDIQPFLQIARVLKKYGHRVRIATHPAFKDFVEKDVGLEFFSIGGDPSELMAFMVKNPGLIPNLETVRQGEIARRRKGMAEIFEGLWRACVNATDDEGDKANMKMSKLKKSHVSYS